MPNPLHQSLLELLKYNPRLVFELAHHFDDQFGTSGSDYAAASNELPDPAHPGTILHADWAIAEVAAREPKLIHAASVAVEVETSFNPLKAFSWLSHAAGVRRLFLCRGWTLVFASDEDVRRKAQKMFETEPRASPWFVVPEMLPPITEIGASIQDVDRSVLTALFHARLPVGVACARATLEALKRVAHPHRRIYCSAVAAALTKDDKELLPKELLQWDDTEPLGPMELTGAYYVRGHEEGRVGALAKAIEAVCELLQLPFGPDERARMQASDADGLEALHAELVKNRRWPSPA